MELIGLTGGLGLAWFALGIWGIVYTTTDILRRRRLARDAANNSARARTNLNRRYRTGFPNPDSNTKPGSDGEFVAYYLDNRRTEPLRSSDSRPGGGTVRRDNGGPSAAAVFLSGKPHSFHASPVVGER